MLAPRWAPNVYNQVVILYMVVILGGLKNLKPYPQDSTRIIKYFYLRVFDRTSLGAVSGRFSKLGVSLWGLAMRWSCQLSTQSGQSGQNFQKFQSLGRLGGIHGIRGIRPSPTRAQGSMWSDREEGKKGWETCAFCAGMPTLRFRAQCEVNSEKLWLPNFSLFEIWLWDFNQSLFPNSTSESHWCKRGLRRTGGGRGMQPIEKNRHAHLECNSLPDVPYLQLLLALPMAS